MATCLHEEECDCYGLGYAHGKAKAHFEIRAAATNNHALDCDCEPCITVRTVVDRLPVDDDDDDEPKSFGERTGVHL